MIRDCKASHNHLFLIHHTSPSITNTSQALNLLTMLVLMKDFELRGMDSWTKVEHSSINESEPSTSVCPAPFGLKEEEKVHYDRNETAKFRMDKQQNRKRAHPMLWLIVGYQVNLVDQLRYSVLIVCEKAWIAFHFQNMRIVSLPAAGASEMEKVLTPHSPSISFNFLPPLFRHNNFNISLFII